MNLKQYERNVIESALAAKGLNHRKLADKLGRSNTSVHKAISGTSTIKSAKLESDIVAALQPELDLIHEALGQVV